MLYKLCSTWKILNLDGKMHIKLIGKSIAKPQQHIIKCWKENLLLNLNNNISLNFKKITTIYLIKKKPHSIIMTWLNYIYFSHYYYKVVVGMQAYSWDVILGKWSLRVRVEDALQGVWFSYY